MLSEDDLLPNEDATEADYHTLFQMINTDDDGNRFPFFNIVLTTSSRRLLIIIRNGQQNEAPTIVAQPFALYNAFRQPGSELDFHCLTVLYTHSNASLAVQLDNKYRIYENYIIPAINASEKVRAFYFHFLYSLSFTCT